MVKLFALPLAALAVVAATGIGASISDAEPSIAPVSASPNPAVFDDAGHVEIEISNDTGAELQGIKAFTVDDSSTVTEPTSIAAGRSIKLRVFAAQSNDDKAQIKDNTLVVVVPPGPATGESGFTLRVPIASAKAVTPAVSEWAMTIRKFGRTQGEDLPLTGPCGALGVDKKQVGVLQAGGADLVVKAHCLSETAETVRLTVPGPGWGVSSYNAFKGKLKFGAGDAATIDATVTTTTGLFPFLGLIATGIGIAIALGSWQLRRGPEQAMRAEALRVLYMVSPTNKSNADTQFQDVARKKGLASIQTWIIGSAVSQEASKILTTLKLAMRSADDPKDALAEAQASIAALETFARVWSSSTANELAELEQLRPSIELALAYWKEVEPRTLGLEPAGGKLDYETAVLAQNNAKEALQLARVINPALISSDLALAQKALSDDNFREVADGYIAALSELRAVSTAAEVGVALTKLGAAREQLAITVADRPAPIAAYGLRNLSSTFASSVSSGPPVFTPEETSDPLGSVNWLTLQRAVIDYLILAVLVAAAVIGAVATLWDDEAFGGWIDWSTALAWGVGSSLISGVVAAAAFAVRRDHTALKSLDDLG